MMNDECKVSDLDQHKICKVVQRLEIWKENRPIKIEDIKLFCQVGRRWVVRVIGTLPHYFHGAGKF